MKENKEKEYEYSMADVIFSTKLKEIFVNPGRCIDANLYRDEDGEIYVFWSWLTNHGIGPDHGSRVVRSVDELRASLMDDVDQGLISMEKVDQLCEECKGFFEE